MATQPSPSFEGVTALVTGGSGFIGRHLLRRLADAGAQVHATTRREVTDDLPTHARWHRLELRDAVAVERVVSELRPELVFHLASHVAGARDLELVLPTFEGNLTSTVNLLRATSLTGCRRFIQVGSLEEPEDDASSAVPSSPYAAAKLAATAYARMFHHLYQAPVVIARVFMVYGPGVQDENKLVPYVIRSLLRGETPSFGSGTRPVDWISVHDVVEGFLRLATASDLEGRRVDLGTGELTTVRGVVEEVFRQMAPEKVPSFGDRADRRTEQVRRADVDDIEARLGWRPAHTVPEGLASTIDWFRRHPG